MPKSLTATTLIQKDSHLVAIISPTDEEKRKSWPTSIKPAVTPPHTTANYMPEAEEAGEDFGFQATILNITEKAAAK